MPSRRERTRPVALLLNSVDLLGRTVDPFVLSVAQEMANRAVAYGERLLGDPALALSLYEEAAATVSKTVAKKKGRRKVGHSRPSELSFSGLYEENRNQKEVPPRIRRTP